MPKSTILIIVAIFTGIIFDQEVLLYIDIYVSKVVVSTLIVFKEQKEWKIEKLMLKWVLKVVPLDL